MADINRKGDIDVRVVGGTNQYAVEPNMDGSINTVDLSSSLADQKKVYTISFDYNLASTGEKLALYINNPTGSGKVLKLIDLTIGLTNTVGSMAIIRLYANPTITANGTAVAIQPSYVGASQPASAMLAYSGPTASANGSQYFSVQINGGTNGGQTLHFDFDQSLLIAENNRLLLTGNPDGTNRNTLITVRWAEV